MSWNWAWQTAEEMAKCPRCKGKGEIRHPLTVKGLFSFLDRTHYVTETCWHCLGVGFVRVIRPTKK